jgi:hypothetical protein
MFPLTALLEVGGKLIDKLIPDPEAKAKAQLDLAKMAQDGELAKMANDTELYKAEQNNLSERHTADMASDSWLSKHSPHDAGCHLCWLLYVCHDERV